MRSKTAEECVISALFMIAIIINMALPHLKQFKNLKCSRLVWVLGIIRSISFAWQYVNFNVYNHSIIWFWAVCFWVRFDKFIKSKQFRNENFNFLSSHSINNSCSSGSHKRTAPMDTNRKSPIKFTGQVFRADFWPGYWWLWLKWLNLSSISGSSYLYYEYFHICSASAKCFAFLFLHQVVIWRFLALIEGSETI